MIATFTKAQKPPCALAQALRRHDTAGSTHAGERGIVRDDTRYADCLFSDGPVGFDVDGTAVVCRVRIGISLNLIGSES